MIKLYKNLDWMKKEKTITNKLTNKFNSSSFFRKKYNIQNSTF